MSRLLEKWGVIPLKGRENGQRVYDYSNILKNIFDYNLMGLDYGDGEFSGYKIKVIRDEKAACGYRIEMTALRLDNSGRNFRAMTTFYRYKVTNLRGEEIWKYDLLPSGNIRAAQKRGAEVYSNFKKCPGTAAAQEFYEFEDGNQSDMTYEEVMAKGFGLVFKQIVTAAENNIDSAKKTIVLVGCPSSSIWVGREKRYADILKSGIVNSEELRRMGFTEENVCVAIHKESNAAMAQAMNLLGGGNRRLAIIPGEITVIIDNGSSTVDITVAVAEGITANGEDSYQFGGNTLDENLMTLVKRELAKRGLKPINKSGQKIGMRDAKERGYGSDIPEDWNAGYWQHPTYSFNAKNEEGNTFEVRVHLEYNANQDDNTGGNDIYIGMSEALNEVSCSAYHLSEVQGGVIPEVVGKDGGEAWLDMLRTIYTKLYNGYRGQFNRIENGRHVPHHLVLCGGVSIMPEVKQIAEEVFGCSAETPDAPNFTVSKGLANVLGVEVIKTLLLEEIESRAEKYMLGKAGELKNKIVQCAIDDEWKIFSDALDEWVNHDGSQSADDFVNIYQRRHGDEYDMIIKRGVKDWYEQEIQTQIEKYMNEYFQALFPGYVKEFNYRLDDENAVGGISMGWVYIQCDLEYFFGDLTCNEKVGRIFDDEIKKKQRDRQWRNKARENIRSRKDGICRGGNITVCYRRTMTRQEGFIFKHDVEYVGTSMETIRYKGYKGAYEAALTDDGIARLVNRVIERIKPALSDFVEEITPYLN